MIGETIRTGALASSNAKPVPIEKLIIAGITDIHLLNAESSSASTITYDLFGLGLMFVVFAVGRP